MPKFWHKKYFVLEIETFRLQVGICVNLSEAEIKVRLKGARADAYKQICEELDGWDKDRVHAGVGRMCVADGGYIVLVEFDKNDFRESVAVLVHELTHVAQYILRDRRVPLTEDSEEVYCYLVQHLTEASLRKLY